MPDHVRGLFGIPAPVIAIAIAGKRISDEDLSAIASLSTSKGLPSTGAQFRNVAIGEIARLQRLRALNIFACEGITDSGIARLGRANSSIDGHRGWPYYRPKRRCPFRAAALTALALHCQNLDDEAITALAALQRLENLDVRGTSISEEGLARLRKGLANTIVLGDDRGQ